MAFTPAEVHALLNPTSIALVGATDNGIWATVMNQNLRTLGFTGNVHMVNPRRDEVFGQKSYPTIQSIPDSVDHALVVAPAGALPGILEDAAASGVKGLTVIASGFQEAGPEGLALAEQVRQFCVDHRIGLIGPNCYGFANYIENTFVTRNTVHGYRGAGKIGIASQSGGLNLSIAQAAYARGIGLGFLISSGNELVVDSNDYYEYFLSRDDITVIGGTLERIPEPDRFAAIAEKAREMGRPMVILKLGKSDVMQRMSLAHTGSVAGSDVIVDTFLRDLGVIRVDTIEELVETTGLLAEHGWPRGNRTFSVAISGGNSGLLADTAAEVGMDLVTIDEDLRQRIATLTGLPPSAVHNPLDATTEGIPHLLPLFDMVADPEKHDVVLFNVFEPLEQADAEQNNVMAQPLAALRDRGVYVARWGSYHRDPKDYEVEAIAASGVPWLRGLDGLKALGNAMWYGQRRAELEATPRAERHEPPASVELRPGAMSEREGKELLAAYGIPTPAERLATSAEDAVAAAEAMGYPVVLKIVSADIAHKSEAGGVIVGVGSADEVREAYDRVLANATSYKPDASIEGVLVSEQITDAAEFFIGVNSDPAVGQIVVAGLGGIYVEILQDVVTMTPPVTPERAKQLLLTLKSAAILKGARGRPELDIDAFADAVARVSQLAADYRGRIDEIDINPLFVLPKGRGVRAADALVVVREDVRQPVEA